MSETNPPEKPAVPWFVEPDEGEAESLFPGTPPIDVEQEPILPAEAAPVAPAADFHAPEESRAGEGLLTTHAPPALLIVADPDDPAAETVRLDAPLEEPPTAEEPLPTVAVPPAPPPLPIAAVRPPPLEASPPAAPRVPFKLSSRGRRPLLLGCAVVCGGLLLLVANRAIRNRHAAEALRELDSTLTAPALQPLRLVTNLPSRISVDGNVLGVQGAEDTVDYPLTPGAHHVSVTPLDSAAGHEARVCSVRVPDMLAIDFPAAAQTDPAYVLRLVSSQAASVRIDGGAAFEIVPGDTLERTVAAGTHQLLATPRGPQAAGLEARRYSVTEAGLVRLKFAAKPRLTLPEHTFAEALSVLAETGTSREFGYLLTQYQSLNVLEFGTGWPGAGGDCYRPLFEGGTLTEMVHCQGAKLTGTVSGRIYAQAEIEKRAAVWFKARKRS